MPLTDVALRKIKLRDQPFKLTDGGGLYLHVKPNGTKAWRLDYRHLGKRGTLSLGLYPTVGLAEARVQRESTRRLLAEGKSPAREKAVKKAEAISNGANTFGAIADEYLQKMGRDQRAQPTITKNAWMMRELSADLSDRPIREITSADVLAVLRDIEGSGRIDSALATRSAIGRVFRYAIATMRAENDPTFALRGALQRHIKRHHPAATTWEALGGILRAIYGYEGSPSVTSALKIQALCFQRPSETRLMEWGELDLQKARWIIPATKMKMRRTHEVPLSQQAVEVIESMRPFSGKRTHVFPSMVAGKAVLSENTMNAALRRMGIEQDQHTAHGFRSSASTLLNESGQFSTDAIEAQLAHQDPNAVRRAYNRAAYSDERVRMMQWWADQLDACRGGSRQHLTRAMENGIPSLRKMS